MYLVLGRVFFYLDVELQCVFSVTLVLLIMSLIGINYRN
ncbi:hypothetical protein J2S14_003209 [Lederbergia wuyishanensis]|uniref:NADH dehydrogenase subunit 4L n=1 Tax=Lederbergia wuyishanensis TaxID=1347903 RepID=A0ABU0D7N9_9BACI|nr:hypothetical protein [Lederbergia wuyishanensis]